MLLTHHTPDGLRRSRQQSLTLYGLPEAGAPDTVVESLSELARLARAFTGADGAAVNVLPAGRQVTLAATSPEHPTELPEADSFCATLLEQRPMATIMVNDLSRDVRFAANPYVDGTLSAVRGFAISPLVGRERIAIGTLCVYWLTPRTLTRDETSMLDQLARAAVNVLDDARRDCGTVHRFAQRRLPAGTVPAA